MFTDSDSLANTVKKDVGQSPDKRFRIVVSMLREGFRISGKYFAAVVADSLVSRRSLDEDDGKGHSCLVLQESWPPVCGQEDLREQSRHRECLRVVLPRNKFEPLPTESDATDS